MEVSQSIHLALHLQFFPQSPLNHTRKHLPKTKSSAAAARKAQNPTKHYQQNPKFPAKRHRQSSSAKPRAFPSPLPLHSRNPRAIYRDIQRFAAKDKLDEALTIMDYMDQQGMPVNSTTFSFLIAACVRSKSLPQAKQIHAFLRVNGLENNEFLRAKLVQMYTCCGSLEDAKGVFEGWSFRSVYPWNALLRGIVISGAKRYRDVLVAYAEMRESNVELNVYTFSTVIKSFAGASALRQGLKAHALLVKNGFIQSSLLQTCLIDMYFKCGKVRLAVKVFDEMPERDIVLWGTMVAGFAHNRLQREALEYVRWMVSKGMFPNSVIVTTILPVIGEIPARRIGQEFHCYVLKTKNYSRRLPIQSGLIDMYCKCGDMGSGRRVFYGSIERNTVSWTALMSGYVSNGKLEQALRSVIWMQQEGFRPDVVTVATAIPVCTKLRDLNRGKEIHAYALKNLFLPNVSISTSLIMMYSNCGVLDYSVKLFEGMVNRNVILWTAMIDSYVKNGDFKVAFCVFRSMLSTKHMPDSVLIARMLSASGEIDASKLGKEIHGHVLKKDFLKIPFVSAEVVKMYGRCGMVYSAKSVFNTIPVKGSMTWTAIIEAYGCNNMWKEAVNHFDEMRSHGFTPNNFTFKVVLAICDRAGYADDARRVIKLISQRHKLDESEEEHYSAVI